jgi:hypothetical protein
MIFFNYAVLTLCFLFSLKADDQKNHIYFELAGHGIMYSLNYERMISEDFYLRAGASVFEFGLWEGTGSKYTVFPLAVGVITGKTRHHNEFGVGLDIIYREYLSGDHDIKKYYTPIALAAYRYHYENGWVFRASFTPFYDIEEGIFPSFGLSLGKRF